MHAENILMRSTCLVQALGLSTQMHMRGIEPVIAVGNDYRDNLLSIKNALMLGLMHVGIHFKDISSALSPIATLHTVSIKTWRAISALPTSIPPAHTTNNFHATHPHIRFYKPRPQNQSPQFQNPSPLPSHPL
jgi:hypothetical protein